MFQYSSPPFKPIHNLSAWLHLWVRSIGCPKTPTNSFSSSSFNSRWLLWMEGGWRRIDTKIFGKTVHLCMEFMVYIYI